MNDLDDLLDSAAVDLRAAVDRLLTEEPYELAPATAEITCPVVGLPQRGARRVLVAVSLGVAAAVVGGLIAAGSRSGGDTTIATPPESLSTFAPLHLATTPTGYATGQKVTRPPGISDVRAAILVKRDASGKVVDKVIARAGTLSEFAGTNTALTVPPNLAGATDGSIQFSSTEEIVRLQFQLVVGRRLLLEAHHPDNLTTERLAGEMQQLVAVLRIDDTNDISVTSALPVGWEFVAAGNEPENAVPTSVQAFEVDRPDGGAKIIVSDIGSDDPALPYWEMLDTLTPLTVRGHDGFVSLDTNVYTGSATPVPTLIWQEGPGHWVTLRADGMSTDQLTALAETLTAADGEWTSGTAGTTTTTTLAP